MAAYILNTITCEGESKLGLFGASGWFSMYINQQDAQNSCDLTLFPIRCSTCFGLY